MKRLALAAAVLLAFSAQAQDVRYGVQAGLSLPESDMGTYLGHTPGFNIGLNAMMDFRGGNALVPRLVFGSYSGNGTIDNWDVKSKMNTLALGADYDHYFSNKCGDGVYIGAGAGIINAHLTATVTDQGYVLTGVSASATKTAFYVAAKVGYAWNPDMALEFRFQTFTASQISASVVDLTGRTRSLQSASSVTGQTLDVSFVYRFK